MSSENKKIMCNCTGCVDLNPKEMSNHLSNMYSKLDEYAKLIDDQQQTLTLIFKELIPLIKNVCDKQQQTMSMLTKIESLN